MFRVQQRITEERTQDKKKKGGTDSRIRSEPSRTMRTDEPVNRTRIEQVG